MAARVLPVEKKSGGVPSVLISPSRKWSLKVPELNRPQASGASSVRRARLSGTARRSARTCRGFYYARSHHWGMGSTSRPQARVVEFARDTPRGGTRGATSQHSTYQETL